MRKKPEFCAMCVGFTSTRGWILGNSGSVFPSLDNFRVAADLNLGEVPLILIFRVRKVSSDVGCLTPGIFPDTTSQRSYL